MKRAFLTVCLVSAMGFFVGCEGGSGKSPPPQAGQEVTLPVPKGSKAKNAPPVERVETVPLPNAPKKE